MPLIPCPACGRDVSDAAATCPQCGQPIAGVVTPPPITVRAPLPDLSIPVAARADAPRSPWLRGLVYVAALGVSWWVVAAVVGVLRGPPTPPAKPTAEDVVRDRAADDIRRALAGQGIEYVTWHGDTLQIVSPRLRGDMAPMADAACNALRARAVSPPARVVVVERNAYLNRRREVLSEARCSL